MKTTTVVTKYNIPVLRSTALLHNLIPTLEAVKQPQHVMIPLWSTNVMGYGSEGHSPSNMIQHYGSAKFKTIAFTDL